MLRMWVCPPPWVRSDPHILGAVHPGPKCRRPVLRRVLTGGHMGTKWPQQVLILRPDARMSTPQTSLCRKNW